MKNYARVGVALTALAWSSACKNNPEISALMAAESADGWQAAWTGYVVHAIDDFAPELIGRGSGSGKKLPIADVGDLCPNYEQASLDQKKMFWTLVLASVASVESAFQTSSTGSDGRGGLLRLKVGDEGVHHNPACKALYSGSGKHTLNEVRRCGCFLDQRAPAGSFGSVEDPETSLRCGVAILVVQMAKHGKLFTTDGKGSGGAYFWSSLTPTGSERFHAYFANHKATMAPFCDDAVRVETAAPDEEDLSGASANAWASIWKELLNGPSDELIGNQADKPEEDNSEAFGKDPDAGALDGGSKPSGDDGGSGQQFEKGGGYVNPMSPSGNRGSAWCACRDIGTSPHIGQDLNGPNGNEHSVALNRGTVTQITFSESCGYFVYFQDKNGATWRYLHLNEPRVKEGQTLNAGDAIGEHSDYPSSSCGSGPHLHLERQSAGPFGDSPKGKDCGKGYKNCNYDPNRLFEDGGGDDSEAMALVDVNEVPPPKVVTDRCYQIVSDDLVHDLPAETGNGSKLTGRVNVAPIDAGRVQLAVAAGLADNAANRCGANNDVECVVTWAFYLQEASGWRRLFIDQSARNRPLSVAKASGFCAAAGQSYTVVGKTNLGRVVRLDGNL